MFHWQFANQPGLLACQQDSYTALLYTDDPWPLSSLEPKALQTRSLDIHVGNIPNHSPRQYYRLSVSIPHLTKLLVKNDNFHAALQNCLQFTLSPITQPHKYLLPHFQIQTIYISHIIRDSYISAHISSSATPSIHISSLVLYNSWKASSGGSGQVRVLPWYSDSLKSSRKIDPLSHSTRHAVLW